VIGKKMSILKRGRSEISSGSMETLESEAILLLSKKLNKDDFVSKRSCSRKRDDVIRKRRRWGNIMILNTEDFFNDRDLLNLKSCLPLDVSDPSYMSLNPKAIILPNGINFARWSIAHMVFKPGFQNENTSELLRDHVSCTSVITENYWRFRFEMMNPKSTLSLSPYEEESLLSSYAIYTQGDERFLRHAFPSRKSFPSCPKYEMFDRVKFIKQIIYPVYKSLIETTGWLERFRSRLRAGQDIYLMNDAFPSLKILKEKQTVLYHAHCDIDSGFFTINQSSANRALQSFQSIESICNVILAAIILMVDKEWFG
jgi:hypothetical protein